MSDKGTTPIPDRKHLTLCLCMRRPYIGLNFDEEYRVACMEMAGGCGLTTKFWPNKISAENAWNKGKFSE